ncbi:major facilitator superfamily domain-containing protein [Talaromyces proteolyticus]|uniref:Major facilitator superfamily domain-containing protein n=1 Tax=Talaromyces proteolyticus TaxID=1131652 RepID=A0AAD4PUD5_9EURO|nr:major facilitator superfamily domain-containing protein [Talaromyces proteolyticus]KAH8689997.1 major facilitator superfamily domain-containing protein [Talaromyces proteolyticus]
MDSQKVLTGNTLENEEFGQEKRSNTSDHVDDAPDGGMRAWLVVAGGAGIYFCCMGFTNSFGEFVQYYLSHQLRDRSADEVAWIGSLSAFLQFSIGVLAGPLFDRFGAWILRPAGVAYIFSLMMLSLCKEYWQFMLVQGVLMGITMGFLQIPGIAAVSQYFEKKRAAALGIVVSGSSIGGIVIPIAVSRMLNSSSLGFGWTVRIIGFIFIPLMGFAIIAVTARLPPRSSNFFITAAFKDKKYVMLIAALFFMFLGMFTPLFYIPSYAVYRGMDTTLAGYMLAILNASSTFGRIIPGILADKYGRLNIFSLGGIATAILILCMNKVTSNAALIVYAIIIGFASGTIVSGAATAFSTCPESPRDLGTYMGMGMAISSLATLLGPPVEGVLLDHYGGYLQISIFSGVLCLVGGIIAFFTKMTTPQGLRGWV